MSHFNQCSQLIDGVEKATDSYKNAIEKGIDPFQVMLDMQRSLQTKLSSEKNYIPNPDNLETAGEVLSWLRNQKDYIDDEFRELITSLGEMSRGDKDASSVWKPWKARHLEAQARKVSDMTPEDQLEIKFELVDILHFFLCMCLGLGIDSKELFELYYLKNAENFERQKNGY